MAVFFEKFGPALTLLLAYQFLKFLALCLIVASGSPPDCPNLLRELLVSPFLALEGSNLGFLVGA